MDESQENRFDDNLLAAYADGFYGYGAYNGDYWFVGMEEGGGDAFDEVDAKLEAWNGRGRQGLEDLAAFHHEIGTSQWFGAQARLQPTWSKYSRIVLSAEGHEVSTDRVRRHQAEQLGRGGGNSCLVELLPLPSPSLGHWHYERWSRLPQLRDRQAYMEHYARARSRHIRERIEGHQPKAVLFSSVDSRYLVRWREIADVDLEKREVEGRACFVGERRGTLFVVITHPVAMGITNAYFDKVGRLLDR